MQEVPLLHRDDVKVPVDVPEEVRDTYVDNFFLATHVTGQLMLFAGDQKIEHQNDDFYGEMELGRIPADDNDPEHLFRIAKDAKIGVFAAQMGLISLYGMDYPEVPYLVKINSKTHLIKKDQEDPRSISLVDIADILTLRDNGLNILGVGYTVYLGSKHESDMLAEAGRFVSEAHRNGLITVIWMYPRGASVDNEKDAHLIAGACGTAACLGSDFVKVNYPKAEGKDSAELLKEGVTAAGRTGVLTAGGGSMPEREFIEHIYKIIYTAGGRGNATGRNVHQKPLDKAIAMCNAISSITFGGYDPNEAFEVYEGRKKFDLPHEE